MVAPCNVMGRWASLVRRTPYPVPINAALVLTLLIAAVMGMPLAAASSAHLAIGHHGTVAMHAATHHPEWSSDDSSKQNHTLMHATGVSVHQLQPEHGTGIASVDTAPLCTIAIAVFPAVPADLAGTRRDLSVLQRWRL